MNRAIKLQRGRILAFLCCGLLASGSVFADKPSRSGYDGGNDHGQSASHKSDRQDNDRAKDTRPAKSESRDNRSDSQGRNDQRQDGNAQQSAKGHDDRDSDRYASHRYFDEQRRNRVHEYYARMKRSGRCPPGLAKRHNGCVAPGHQRRWEVGHRLPRDVIFHNVDPQVLSYLGPPPPRHRFVRVASDILLIAVGTGMVVDAIDDLSGN